jgi:uncharacterized protein YjbI with pentapeptide repeats
MDIKKAWIPSKDLKNNSKQVICSVDDESFIAKNKFEDCSFLNITAENSEVEQNIFEKCVFDNVKMSGLLLKNIRLNNCNTSHTSIKHSKIVRAEFNYSKCLGISFESSIGRDITFLNCNCQYADFRRMKFKTTIFEDCILREADFQGADLSGAIFKNCDLREAQLSFTKLNGTDFCSSKIEGIRIQPESLRGAIVDYHQAAYLGSKFLGVKIN